MGDRIENLKVGKLADLLVWDALSPSMACASRVTMNRFKAVVLHSSPADLEMGFFVWYCWEIE
jgi:imidazolonepropionase-like amidohydrolase